jgi:hypothetical protein
MSRGANKIDSLKNPVVSYFLGVMLQDCHFRTFLRMLTLISSEARHDKKFSSLYIAAISEVKNKTRSSILVRGGSSVVLMSKGATQVVLSSTVKFSSNITLNQPFTLTSANMTTLFC